MKNCFKHFQGESQWIHGLAGVQPLSVDTQCRVINVAEGATCAIIEAEDYSDVRVRVRAVSVKGPGPWSAPKSEEDAASANTDDGDEGVWVSLVATVVGVSMGVILIVIVATVCVRNKWCRGAYSNVPNYDYVNKNGIMSQPLSPPHHLSPQASIAMSDMTR